MRRTPPRGASFKPSGDVSRAITRIHDEPVDPAARSPNVLVDALVGTVVAVVLAFVPLSPVLGGGVAGYLQGADRSVGLRVGLLAGLLAAVPLGVLGVLVAAVFVVGPNGGGALLSSVALVVAVLVAAVYGGGLGVLGGYVGAALAERRVE